jgi:hypothetical protein
MIKFLLIIVGIVLLFLGTSIIKENDYIEMHLIGATLAIIGFGLFQFGIFFIVVSSL